MTPAYSFKLDVSIDDRTGHARAVYLRVRTGEVEETREVVPGTVNADYDGTGKLLGIELLAPCTVDVLDRISLQEPEPEPIRTFFRSASPRELVPG